MGVLQWTVFLYSASNFAYHDNSLTLSHSCRDCSCFLSQLLSLF